MKDVLMYTQSLNILLQTVAIDLYEALEEIINTLEIFKDKFEVVDDYSEKLFLLAKYCSSILEKVYPVKMRA